MPQNIAKTGPDWFRPVVNRFWSGPVRTSLVTAKKPQKTGLQWSSPVFCRFGENEDQTRLSITIKNLQRKEKKNTYYKPK